MKNTLMPQTQDEWEDLILKQSKPFKPLTSEELKEILEEMLEYWKK